MNEKEVYAVYVGILRTHRDYADKLCVNAENRESFINRINIINNTHNTWFCYYMCEVLRQWFIHGFSGIENDSIAKLYSDLWHFHKAYLNKELSDELLKKAIEDAHIIGDRYGNIEPVKKMLVGIMDSIDR